MPRLRRTPDKLVFLVTIAAPDKILLLPLLFATAFFGLLEFVAIGNVLHDGSHQESASFF